MNDEITAAAYHEAGHAVAYAHAFRNARWLPYPRPQYPVVFVCITKTEGGWGGKCRGSNHLYSPRWDCVTPRFKPLMELQITIELGGGVAESLQRGEELGIGRCGMDSDFDRALALLDGDLFKVTGRRADLLPFIERTRAMLLAHWDSVERLARNLIELGRIEGERVEEIVSGQL
jgi:hypothetical protein